MGKSATVIVPTTKDRGPLLPYSVGSILNQTVKDIEVFIIGDGVYEETRNVINELMKKDNRIRFFDHPKHERRGELYRHEALQEAEGKIVCYLCDRDLMLPFHIENLLKHYDEYNLVTSHYFSSESDGELIIGVVRYIGNISKNLQIGEASRNIGGIRRGFQLSNLSHSLDLYRKLNHGWRTTPKNYFTDYYMYEQLLSNDECKPFFSIYPPSIIYIKRGDHEVGWQTDKRCKDLVYWYQIIKKENYLDELKDLALKGLFLQRNNLLKKNKGLKRKIFNFAAFLNFFKGFISRNFSRF